MFSAEHADTVGVAQLVERQTVDLDVAGSNPVTHPKQRQRMARAPRLTLQPTSYLFSPSKQGA